MTTPGTRAAPYAPFTTHTANADLDSWLPAGGRTVADVPTYLANNAIFNALDYGAVSGTNVTAALTTAFAAATGTSVAVLLPAGTWSIDDVTIPANGVFLLDSGAVLTINSGHILSVSDGASILGRSRLGSVIHLGTNSQIALVGADGNNQVRYCNLERFRIQANDLASTTPMVQLTWAASSVIRNLYTQRVSAGGLFDVNTSAQTSFDNIVTIATVNGPAINIHDDSDGTSITNSRLTGGLVANIFGILVDGTGGGHAQTVIKNCVMESWDICVRVASRASTKLVTIEDLYAEGYTTAAIAFGYVAGPYVAQQCTARRIYGNSAAAYVVEALDTTDCTIESVRGVSTTSAVVYLAPNALTTRVGNVVKESGAGVTLSVDAAATYMPFDCGKLTTHTGGSVLTDDGSNAAIFTRASANPAAQWQRTGTGAFSSTIGLTTTGLEASADWKVDGKFGCNGVAVHAAVATAALAAYGAGANGFDTAGHAQEIHDKLDSVIATLKLFGLMS